MDKNISYRDIFHQSEERTISFNFDLSDANIIKDFFKNSEKQAEMLIENNYSIPAYDYLIHCYTFLICWIQEELLRLLKQII